MFKKFIVGFLTYYCEKKINLHNNINYQNNYFLNKTKLNNI